MVCLLSVLQHTEFLWNQTMISGSHGLKYLWDCRDIKEVKPACVLPDVKEFKTGFFSFDCRPDKYGGKEGIGNVWLPAKFWFPMVKIPSESQYLYHWNKTKGFAWSCHLLLSSGDFHSPSSVFGPSLFSCSHSLPQTEMQTSWALNSLHLASGS